MLYGYNSYGAMAQWSQEYGSDLARELGFKDGKIRLSGQSNVASTRRFYADRPDVALRLIGTKITE
jgi:hypothetical protein